MSNPIQSSEILKTETSVSESEFKSSKANQPEIKFDQKSNLTKSGNNLLDNLSAQIAKLPGMGPRIAKRLVLKLAMSKEKLLKPLISSLNDLNEKIFPCQKCGNFDEGDICGICQDASRDDSQLCVVESVADLWAIERAKNFLGRYFVLGGNMMSADSRGISEQKFEDLFAKITKEGVKEIIIATSATIEGQTTAHFISDQLKDCAVKITRLTYGIPVGGELDYLDEGTISIAIKTRSPLF